VQHLAGGNPRVYTLFAQFLSKESLDDLVDAFMKMLDDLTPYYQSRMKDLSNQQRKIVELLVDRRRAVMVKEIGDDCFIEQRSVASQLSELKKKGYVVSTQVGRESGYELSEVLMRFCMEVKKFRGRWVELVVDFLKVWYRPAQRRRMLEKFGDSKLMARHDLERVFLSDDDPLGDICIREFKKSLDQQNQVTILRIAEELQAIDVITHDEHQQFLALVEEQDYAEILRLLERSKSSQGKAQQTKLSNELFLEGLLFQMQGKWLEAIESYDRAIFFKPDLHEAWCNRGHALDELGRYEEAIKSYNRAISFKPDYYESWSNRGNSLGNLGDYEESIESFDRALAIKSDNYIAWSNRGISLGYLGKYIEAIKSHDRAINIKHDYVEAWGRRGYALYSSGRYEEAIESYDQLIAIKPDDVDAWHDKGWVYFLWGKYSESINYFEKTIAIQSNRYDSWHNKGLAQFVTGDYAAVLVTWQQAFRYISDPAVPRYYEDISRLIQDFIEELIPRFTQPAIQQTLLVPLLPIYQQANVITELGAALVNTLHLIVAPNLSDHTAAQWLALWQTSSLGQEPAMELPLRLMATAIEYKKDPSKRDRLWLNLPSEERPILDQVLQLSD
jgi:tetratricopeptide (TPR) repeat protein/predicted DNA-binding transcriptional regulator